MCDPTPVATTLLPAKARSSASSFDLAGAQLDPREYVWPTAARRSSGALREIFSRSQDLAGSRQLEGGPMCPSDPKENLSLSFLPPSDSPNAVVRHLRKPSATEIFHSQFGAQVRSPVQGQLGGVVQVHMVYASSCLQSRCYTICHTHHS